MSIVGIILEGMFPHFLLPVPFFHKSLVPCRSLTGLTECLLCAGRMGMCRTSERRAEGTCGASRVKSSLPAGRMSPFDGLCLLLQPLFLNCPVPRAALQYNGQHAFPSTISFNLMVLLSFTRTTFFSFLFLPYNWLVSSRRPCAAS